MTYLTLHAFLPIISIFVSIASQFLFLRTIPRLNFYKSVFLGFGCGFFILLSFEVSFIFTKQVLAFDSLAVIFVNIVCFILMQACYFLLINTGVSALRVRFLDELSKWEKGLTLEEIIQYYNPKEITQKRIDKLSAARQIYINKNKIIIKKGPILLIAMIFDFMKLMVFGKRFQRVQKK
jgi:hypothetical protein